MGIDKFLKAYIESNIIPVYNSFDKGHDKFHVYKVINNSISIAKDYEIDINMVYTIAAYHDIGILEGRERHHITSGIILKNDSELIKWFSEEQIEIMREAVEDHRASNKNEPRSIYGKIVAEADRDISTEKIVFRSIAYALKNYPKESYLERMERVFSHIHTKYGKNGYLKLWLNTEKNAKGLGQIRNIIENRNEFQSLYEEIYSNNFNENL